MPNETRLADIRPIRRAYEQVADQLRSMIVSGQVQPGQRLPVEELLARDFGVSRTTLREALRSLSAQNLIRTTRGPAGGNFVTLPRVEHMAALLGSTLTVLADAEAVGLDEFLEARELLETWTARLAAQRRSAEDIARLQASIPDKPGALSKREQFDANWSFHTEILTASGNSLLYLAAQPVFAVLQHRLENAPRGDVVQDEINLQHRQLAAAIAAGDADAAENLMRQHLHFLEPVYQRGWPDSSR
jgi:GntR family transcriptional regulator, transcriptional repressor for pyruvate dehydrogenase complex